MSNWWELLKQVLEALAKDPSATESMKEMIRCREQETLSKVNELELGFPQNGDFHHEGKCRCTQFRYQHNAWSCSGSLASNLGQIGSLNHVKWLGLFTSQTVGVDCNYHVFRQCFMENLTTFLSYRCVLMWARACKMEVWWRNWQSIWYIWWSSSCCRSFEWRVFSTPTHQPPQHLLLKKDSHKEL